jgi:predicted CXXCH cytochrome family protein
VCSRSWLGLWLALLLLAGCELAPLKSPTKAPLPRDRTATSEEADYASSRRCRACHPSEYDSWHRSYHRTMTQRVTPQTVLGPWKGDLFTEGRRYSLLRKGDEFWVDIPKYGSDGSNSSERQELQVLMSTGSHHLQLYWMDDGERLWQFPFGWFIREQRWVPEKATFLQPPAGENHVETRAESWSDGCDGCHSVGPRGNLARGDVAELGIACEACHGPGKEHAKRLSNPVTRLLARQDEAPPDDIVMPSELAPQRSVEACAQCHAELHHKSSDGLLRYKPGEDLSEKAHLLQDHQPRPDWLTEALSADPSLIDNSFWPDGTVRIAGRDANALVLSACYTAGDLVCTDCHSLHGGDPNDQLDPTRQGNALCADCHQGYVQDPSAHTHHPATSSGSQCMNCHMPHTTVGLLGLVRSHRIDSPQVTASLNTGRPNACNLCHLDFNMHRVATHLESWWGRETDIGLRAEAEATATHWLLRGDAAQRATLAWHFGWEPAVEASQPGWQAAYLAELLDDPYDAVRYMAGRSIQKHAGFEDFRYDYVAESGRLEAKVQEARALAAQSGADRPALRVSGGRLDGEWAEKLTLIRNDRDVSIDE